MTTVLSGTFAKRSFGSVGMFFTGIETITTSPARAASLTVTAVAPVSVARSARVSGPRELATKTSCPSDLKRRVSVPPMWPAPIIPILMPPPVSQLNGARRTDLVQRANFALRRFREADAASVEDEYVCQHRPVFARKQRHQILFDLDG